MGKKRVHELAKEYGLENKDVLQRLQAAGVDVKSHSSSVYEEEARAILGKSAEEPEPVAQPVRRPGMVIIKKKTLESGVDAVTLAAEAAAVAEAQGQPAPVEVKPEDVHEEMSASVVEPEAPPAEAAAAEPQQEEAAPVQSEPESEAEPVVEPEPEPAAAAAEAGEQPAAEAAPAEAEAPEPTPQKPAPARPGAAQVVRMIDREKLLERVPGRRLGGGDRGGREGGQRFGQVTELRVVTDPFGRGREMINVGRDKKGKPTAAKPGKKDRAPTKREMLEMRERAMHPSRLKKKKPMKRAAKKPELTERKASKRVIKIKESVVVADLAHQLGVKSVDVISKLMSLGTMVTQNQSIDFDTAQLVAADYGYTVDNVAYDEQNALELVQAEDSPENLKPRAPVVTVMGHVDHGKTSLLDAIRTSRVAAGEAGGITQHIGAYQIAVSGKRKVTFLDTPGHAAFTSMRARGAQVTDIVVLVVAADDGVMPQTEEAIKHAQAAEVPIIVAVNKIDKPDAQPDRVMQELTKFQLVPEAWGGETLFVNTSAVKGTGIKELLESILLQAEVLELRANPDRPATGVVLEAKLDKGRGPVATVLVQQGTLKRGDSVVIGEFAGKVRAMTNDAGNMVNEAGPSAAVEIIGLEGVPEAGDTLHVLETPEKARELATYRAEQKKLAEQAGHSAVTLDDIMKRMQGAEALELKLVLKADVQGSVEALRDALAKQSTDEVAVNVIYGGVGGISESDIMLAAASGGLVIGFNVRPDANARQIAEREGVEIRTYNVIYEALDDVRKAMEGLLSPESKEKIVGHAEVREVFRITKVGQIAGCRVVDGKAMRNARIRVLRDSVQVYDGRVGSLKHFKNDVREIDAGQECGVGIEGFNDIKGGDVLEFYNVEEVARTLQPSASGKRSSGSSGGMAAHP